MASISIRCPSCSATEGVVRNGHEWRRMSRQCTHYGRWPQHGFTSLKKLRPQSVTSRIQPGS
ncbi:IS1 family transposase, partial [Escherichia coli]